MNYKLTLTLGNFKASQDITEEAMKEIRKSTYYSKTLLNTLTDNIDKLKKDT